MNHRVGRGCSAAKALQIFETPPVYFRARRNQRLSARIAAGQTKYAMTGVNKIFDKG